MAWPRASWGLWPSIDMTAKPDAIERFGNRIARLPFVRGQRPEALPIALDRKRIYVLPTRLGLLVGTLVLAMLVGALNYNNNPGLFLAFLLAAVVHNGFVMAHLALSGLRISSLQADAVHAGQSATLRIRLAAGKRVRSGLELRTSEGAEVVFSMTAGEDLDSTLRLPTSKRGLIELPRLRISTTRPLGLARAWSWWRPQIRVLVYPAAETQAPPLPGMSAEGAPKPRAQRNGEDTHHLREYRHGDAPRQIAWKSSARLDRLLVREYEAGTSSDVRLEWASLRHLPLEQRIARLTAWVLEAEREGRRSVLQLPNESIGPGRGTEHRHACLKALALLPAGAP